MKTVMGLIQLVLILVAAFMLWGVTPWWSLCAVTSIAVCFGYAWSEAQKGKEND